MQPTRRRLLKTSGTAVAGLFTTGLATGQSERSEENSSNGKVRIRRRLSNPVSVAEIRERKRQVLEGSSLYAQTEAVPTTQVHGFSEKERILAYNFDIVDGTPIEWTGIYRENEPEAESARKTSPTKVLHSTANERAEKAVRGSTETSSTDGELSTSSVEDDWEDWTKLAESDNLITTDDGNDLSWESKWKKDPDNGEHMGLNTELTLRPYNTGLYPWITQNASMNFDFNGSTYDEISDYGPGNTIGSNTQSFSLGLSSDKVVNVGVSSSTTSSNLDIDNKSDIDANYVKHKFDISGDLKENTVRINQSAVTIGTDPSSGTTYCNQDLDALFETVASYNFTPLERETPSKGIRVYWS